MSITLAGLERFVKFSIKDMQKIYAAKYLSPKDVYDRSLQLCHTVKLHPPGKIWWLIITEMFSNLNCRRRLQVILTFPTWWQFISYTFEHFSELFTTLKTTSKNRIIPPYFVVHCWFKTIGTWFNSLVLKH